MTVQRILDSQQGVERTYVTPDAIIRDVLNSLAFRNVGALVVSTDGDKVEGIISERDIVRGLQKAGADLNTNRFQTHAAAGTIPTWMSC